MNRKKAGLLRAAALMLALVIILVGVCALPASAKGRRQGAHKNIITHDIAIVFDNSASMYENTYSNEELKRWSRALYAVEVFASMLNFDSNNGDRLRIYPMGEMSVGKNGQAFSCNKPLEITKDEQVKDIEKLYCNETSKTTLQPVPIAYNKLVNESDKQKKWLIVLTDGVFHYDDNHKELKKKKDNPNGKFEYVVENNKEKIHPSYVDEYKKWLSDTLSKYADNGVRVHYLAFGDGFDYQVKTIDDHLSADYPSEDSEDSLAKSLVDICNTVFQRDVVPVTSDGKFSIDVSMSKIIAFAQGVVNGRDAEVTSLTSSKGDIIDSKDPVKLDKAQTGGSKTHGGKAANVSGYSATFANVPAGDYSVKYTGKTIQVIYEPNVYVKTTLLDKDGKDILEGGREVPAGEYTLVYELVDGETGEKVENSKLVRDANLSARVKNGKGNPKEVRSGEKIVLRADDETFIEVSGTFGTEHNTYEVDNSENGDPFTISVKGTNPKDLQVKVVCQNRDLGHKWFVLGDHENWKPIDVTVTYKGKALTGPQLEALKGPKFEFSNEDIVYHVEQSEKDKAKGVYHVYIGYKEKDGEYVEPPQGRFTLTAAVTTVDEVGQELSAEGRDSFEIHPYSSIWRWLIWIIGAAILIALIIFVLNLPAWPRRVRFVVEKPREDEGLKRTVDVGSSMKIVPYENALRCKARKNSKIYHWLFQPKRMSFYANGFSSTEIRAFNVNGSNYSQKGGSFKCEGKDEELIMNGVRFEFTFHNGRKGAGHIEIG